MGVGMQIACHGFAGSAAIEAEAGAQLVRLERFRALIGGCHLAIESRTAADGARQYDVRLELVMHDTALWSLPSCVGGDVDDTLRRAFMQAEQALIACQAGGARVGLRNAAAGGALR
ncbi:TPA: metal ABC transporter ATPase [Burkholderia aenigmatica]|uniref:metal ABC transporter ATPase n=1 Tax=Burkholderia sp. AU45251 TaxID=3059204 RepID=UPI0026553FE4|nr:metal ABC transporter ATPase [Burkholderia sp. AU45251]HDR9481528.1 metal ABC transporter ATPase [Burkholderia aenigmatica]MDN7513848.1 metal ABC transporter ATPase [Burkholderia sp. AU45251]HDR9513055.1 metal ABC transporter ATPase [Burkholderia aenigmatica]HDR9589899.1 metal ABC transporter ATPase [Burkholderia aenigmatica]HDR9598096.1 metal ABC transporter ATPase [Burkholderia aenigmatica]